MIDEAIVLAGGLGTRLRSSVPDLPKCMAPVAGIPFIDYVVDHFQAQGIERFIFALGYKHELITEHLQSRQTGSKSLFSIEHTPLGTGGAIRKACELGTKQNILVINGDTFYKVYVQALAMTHENKRSECTLCLKPMHHFDRYGVVELGNDGSVQSFHEKKYYSEGLINGGIYALDRERFLQLEYPDAFSFEKDYLERHAGGKRFFGHLDEGYFIDIGIPEDYERAQKELPALV
jgi:D-glycero-alpha-D-manno-heptose 1-phosphate guanylyltransferase